jgi:Tfp pilus assembly protein PilN
MIRINLLSVREVRRQAVLRHQLQVAVALLVLAVGAGAWVLYTQGQTRQARMRELEQLQAELKSLEKIVKEVEQFQKQASLLEKKVEVIANLKTTQRLPANWLDEISRHLPEQVWIEAIQENNTGLQIRGKSLNGNPGVADFMKNMESSTFFGPAGLVESKSETLQDRQVMAFTITVPLAPPQKKETAVEERGRS